jgi:hypothetical protein
VKSQSSDFSIEVSKPSPLGAVRKLGSHHSIADKLQHTSTSAEAKVALLYWVRIQLEDYIAANLIPSIQDFSRSWRTGVAFCLLIHRHNPSYIPDLFSVHLAADLSEKATWYQLLKLAFDLATNEMGVQAYLEPEDLVDVDYPHEPSVMMYVSEYYKVMSKYQSEEAANIKRERAVKRKATIVMACGGTLDEEDEEEDELRMDSAERPRCESPPAIIEEEINKPTLRQQHLEPPVPIPMPSARRKKKMKQRESTLGEEDKARIKADLNAKLLMQLTGHLPRGVHPILNELLDNHEIVLSFIKSSTRTIDGMPEEFISSSVVTECIDALEIIEEQAERGLEHLDTAERAKNILTSPPETADDTLIRLTDLQRTQVSKLYEMLQKEWSQFESLLKVTKDDLLSVERALIDTEEDSEAYQARAAALMKELDEFTAMLSLVAPSKQNDNQQVDSATSLHPLEGSQINADLYKERLEAYSNKFVQFQNTTWREFKKVTRQLSRAVMQVVSAQSTQVMDRYDALVIGLEKEHQSCKNFERGLIIVQTVKEIESELVLIQSMMEDNGQEKATTNDAIQLLESKVAAVRSTIYAAREEYGDLLAGDVRFTKLFSVIQSRYETVNQWVDQVRVWFIEAERIRSWIEERVQAIQEHNVLVNVDPLGQEFDYTDWTPATTDPIYEEHTKLKREIERFDQDDMTRLRSHVRELTGPTSHNLSPADASTIEITLATLTILNRLKSLLEARSRLIDTLRIRIEWERLMETALEWCKAKDNAILAFMNGKARWKEPDEDEATTHYLKQLTEEVIQTLVVLENSVEVFDKGDFSAVLDKYQKIEDLDGALPRHLEQRQEALEEQFELIMKRRSFVRKVVEQHLTVSDIATQFRKLRTEGEKLKLAMTHSNDTSSNTPENTSFDERVQEFKDNSSSWVTILSRRVPYPSPPEILKEELDESNQIANTVIHDRLNEYSTILAEITEELEELLSSHRENLSLQQRASLAYDDLLRITNWLEERLRAIQKFDTSMIEEEENITLEEETLHRLEKEEEGTAIRLQQLEDRDIKKTLDIVRQLEVEIDQTNSVSIDRSTLINGIERLEQCCSELKDALQLRIQEVDVLRKRIIWESQWEEASVVILDLAHKLWDFNARFAQYDAEGLKKRNSDQVVLEHVDVIKEDLYAQLQEQVDDLQYKLLIVSSDAAFDDMESTYHAYNNENTPAVPEHIAAKQRDIKTKYEGLQCLCSYVSDVLKQHNDIADYVSLSNQAQKNGDLAQEAIQVSLRESSSSSRTNNASSKTNNTSSRTNNSSLEAETKVAEDHKVLVDQLVCVKTQISNLCERGRSFQYLAGGNWFESSQPQTLVSSDDYNTQLKLLINKKLDGLEKLNEALEKILASFQYADSIKSKLKKYQAEAYEIQDWIDKSTQTLNRHHVDVTAAPGCLSRDAIASSRSENTRLVTELGHLESTRLSDLQRQLLELIDEATEHSTSVIEETREACNSLIESVSLSILVFRQATATQLLVLDTAEQRLQWENDMDENQCRIDFLNHQLQQYISKKNKCVAQQDALSEELINQLISERLDINNQCKRFRQDNMRLLENDYEQIKLLFVKLPLTKSIPVHMQERTESLARSLKKLEDALAWREKELEYIQQRRDLESNIKYAMADLDQQRKSISVLLESKGRWNANDDLSSQQQQQIDEVEAQWRDEKQRFDDLRLSVLADIKNKYKTLQGISDSLKPGFMSELHTKKIEVLLQTESHLEDDIIFAHQVITQKKQLSDFIAQTNELESKAESIRELFLSSYATATSVSTSDLTKKLEEFVTCVNQVKSFVSTDILIPKRSNEEHIAMPTKVKDKTMNSVVQDVINTRLGRLDELVESLSALFKSQEVFTRLQYVLKTFKRQIVACETWISSRRDILEKSVHVLDDSDLSLDINQLRDAVSEADSIQTAMQARDNHFTLLCKHRETYIQIFDEQGLLTEEEKEEKMIEYDQVAESFEGINQQWQDLFLETKEVSNALSIALLPAELNGRIAALMSHFNGLQTQIKSVDESFVTDTQIIEWQKRIDYLESEEYDRLHSEIADYRHTISADMIESLMAKLDEAGDVVLQIRATLTGLYDIINASRLRNTHAENSELFHSSAKKLITLIEDVQYGKFGNTTNKKTAEQRAQHFRDLSNVHKQIKEALLESQGFYDDSCSYYYAMKVQDVNTDESEQVQQDVEIAWNNIQTKNSDMSAFVTRTAKWIEGCDELDKLEVILGSLKVDVDTMVLNNQHPSSSSSNKIQKYEKKLLKVTMSQQELENTVKNTTDMAEDEVNKAGFLARSQEIRDLSNAIQQVLDQKRLEKERSTLFEVYKTEIAKVTKICDDQILYIRQQSHASPEHHLKKLDTTNSIINAYSAALSHIQDNYNESKIKYDGIISDQATKLIKVFDHPSFEVETCKSGLDKLLKELKTVLKTENDYITCLKLLGRLMKFDKEISRSISEIRSNVSRSYNGSKTTSRATRSRDLPELKEFMQRYDSIEVSVQEFYQSCGDLKKNINKRISSARISAIIKAVDKREDDMMRKWAEIKSSADDTRERLDTLHKRQTLSAKLNESLSYVNDLKERVEALQLSGKSVSVEEQELDEIQEEIDVTLKKNAADIDTIFKTLNHNGVNSPTTSASEVSFKNQRDKLIKSIEELRQLVKYRREQAHTEGSITEFFGITDQVDAEILKLSKVIEETSTQHASVVGSKFNKADLQHLLKTLVTAYKSSESDIVQLLEKAKSESQKQFLDDNERVAKRLKKTLKDWSTVQASVSSREKELQTCIKELNHEFFTKLAMAKSAPRERRSRRGSKSKQASQLPSSGPRPIGSFRSSTLSTEMKATTPSSTSVRKSKTPTSRNSKYVPDPKSELDVQLGLIVNDSPFQMKVKKVPGEAGKYWFGDDHRRLVYCRILPSKMVMVRVGGGWEELSR